MVISNKYKYLFVETPQTGCSAVREELIKNYAGEAILSKHSLYSTFLAQATNQEKEYFVFSGIRNPLDKTVSTFEKVKSNHRNRYTDRLNFQRSRFFYDLRDWLLFSKVNKDDFNFSDYIKYKKVPYDDMSTLDHEKFNSIIKFESLNEDFKSVLLEIGIVPVRDLPLYNRTNSKRSFLDYYDDDDLKILAQKRFGVFMEHWGYDIPSEWVKYKLTNFDRIIWKFFHFVRVVSWRYFRKGLKDV